MTVHPFDLSKNRINLNQFFENYSNKTLQNKKPKLESSKSKQSNQNLNENSSRLNLKKNPNSNCENVKEEKLNERLTILEETNSKFCNETQLMSLIDNKINKIKTQNKLEIQSYQQKIEILETKLKYSENKYEALIDSYLNDISKIKNEQSEIKEKIHRFDQVSTDVNLRLYLIEDTQSETFKNIVNVYEELKDQSSKIDDIHNELKEQSLNIKNSQANDLAHDNESAQKMENTTLFTTHLNFEYNIDVNEEIINSKPCSDVNNLNYTAGIESINEDLYEIREENSFITNKKISEETTFSRYLSNQNFNY